MSEGGKLPVGTVTFLFTDIEGSTKLLRELGDGYRKVQDDHAVIMRSAISEGDGVEVRTEGDSFFVVFPTPTGAVRAVVQAQRALRGHRWSHGRELRVRMGLHTGEGVLGGDDYLGIDVNRAARIAAAGHGGQVLVSNSTRVLVEAALPDGVSIRDLGSHRLKDLPNPEHLFDLKIDGIPSEFPPIRSMEVPHNLPPYLTSFIGRSREIADLAHLLETERLVVLTGPGGTGKTRLALIVGEACLEDFSDGVFFVDLSPITDPELVPPTIAGTLQIQVESELSILERLQEHLRSLELLLILDNFEQVVEGADAVDSILAAAPGVRVMATSRIPLGLYGEQEFLVEPLDHPDPRRDLDLQALRGFDSVALFVDRAKSVVRGFEPTQGNAGAIAAICSRLDGLPLAIELGACQVKLMTPQQILETLDERLPEMSGPQSLPERQRTLRATIEWSAALLSEMERRLFTRLGVFAGGFTLKAAESVCNPKSELGMDTLNGIGSLIDSSLVRRVETTDGDARFTMLGSIRAFAKAALERSEESDAIAGRHAEHFLAFCEEAEPHLVAEDQAVWFAKLERELDNIRAALGFCVDEGWGDVGVRTGAAIWRFWVWGIHIPEGHRWLEQLLKIPELSDPVRWRGLNALGGVVYWQGEHELADSVYRESLSLAESLGDPRAEMETAYNLGVMALILHEDFEESEERFSRVLHLARELGDRAQEGRTMAFQAVAAHVRGKYDEAIELSEGAVEMLRDAGNPWELANALNELGQARRFGGDLEGAREAYTESLRMLWGAGNLAMVARVVVGMAALEMAGGDLERGVRLFGGGQSILEIVGSRSVGTGLDFGDPISEARPILGEALLEALIEEARSWPPERVVAYALEGS